MVRLPSLARGGYPTMKRNVSPDVRQAVLERDAGRCQYCGAPATDIDHIEGNSNEMQNLQALCSACNTKKMVDHSPLAQTMLALAIRPSLPHGVASPFQAVPSVSPSATGATETGAQRAVVDGAPQAAAVMTLEMRRMCAFDERISASQPTRLCDDDEAWDAVWPTLLKEARRRIKTVVLNDVAAGAGYAET